MSSKRYPVVIERTGTGFSLFTGRSWMCGDGRHRGRTRRNFQEALAAHFDAMREIGEPIPEPHTCVDYVVVAA